MGILTDLLFLGQGDKKWNDPLQSKAVGSIYYSSTFITHKSHSLGLATPLTCYASVLSQLDGLSYIFMHLIIDISNPSAVRISKKVRREEFVEKNSHSLDFSVI